MGICPCGYWWADLDEEGHPISNEYCHYDGPDAWAPCAEEGYELEPDPATEWMEPCDMDFDALYEQTFLSMVEPTFEEYGAPYDYAEF